MFSPDLIHCRWDIESEPEILARSVRWEVQRKSKTTYHKPIGRGRHRGASTTDVHAENLRRIHPGDTAPGERE